MQRQPDETGSDAMTFERAVDAAQRLTIPRLMLVTDRTLARPGALPALVEQAVAGGVDAVQLREKDLPEQELIALGRELRAVTRGRALLLVNGTVEQAMACEADGVHVGEGVYLTRFAALTAPPSLAGKGAGGLGILVGRSVHSVEAARHAEAEGVDYLVLGTIYPSRSHPGGATGGLELVAQVSREVGVPVIAIGGITVENAGEVIRAGASGVAVISAILAAADPRAAAAALHEAVEAARQSPVGEQA
jgi:thiamine-phosphate pyrophosphorylase